MKTLRSKICLFFISGFIVIFAVFSFFIYRSADSLFENYAKNLQKQRTDEIVKQIKDAYTENTGIFNFSEIQIIGKAALQNGLLIHLITEDKEFDWDIRGQMEEECRNVLNHAVQNMHSLYPAIVCSNMQNEYRIESGGKDNGLLVITYCGPFSFNDHETLLIKSMYSLFLVSVIAAVLLSIPAGFLLANAITKPVKKVIEAAEKISRGQYDEKIAETKSAQELSDLIHAVNKMSSDLEKVDAQKKQMTSDVFHELRTPLANLRLTLEAIQDGIYKADSEQISSLTEEIIRLSTIVEKLQELYKIEKSNAPAEKERISAQELFSVLQKNFSAASLNKKIHLTFEADKTTRFILNRPDLLQCLTNLISNAIIYSAAGTRIVVSCKKTAGSIIFTVRDQGPGIEEKDLPHVFERFYRTDKSRSTQTGGLGLGLAITKALVEKSGGRIAVQSAAGEGSEFCIEYDQAQ